MRTVFLIALAAFAAGCASSPTTEAPAAAEPVKAASLAPQAAPAATTAEATTAKGEFKPPPGYKKQVANGNTIYCTKVVVLGSRFPKEDCRSQSELEYMEKQGELMRNDMKQRSSTCTSAAGCVSP